MLSAMRGIVISRRKTRALGWPTLVWRVAYFGQHRPKHRGLGQRKSPGANRGLTQIPPGLSRAGLSVNAAWPYWLDREPIPKLVIALRHLHRAMQLHVFLSEVSSLSFPKVVAVVGSCSVLRIRPRLRPVLIELGGRFIKSDIVASDAEEPARVSMKARDKGWSPYRVRFDDIQAAWIVSTFDRTNPPG